MSIIVKGINRRPVSCFECPLINGSDECVLLDSDTNFIYDDLDLAQTEMCPIIGELSEKHGRLIDGDYLYDRLKALGLKDENVFRIIKEEPTVIESEE